MSLAELQQFVPQNAAEAVALRQISAAIHAWDALPAAKEITDRTEGKAIQRRVDLTGEEAVSKAKLAYALGERIRDHIAHHCQEIACCEECKAQLAQIVPIDHAGLLEAVLSTVDERYHDAVIRELEAMD